MPGLADLDVAGHDVTRNAFVAHEVVDRRGVFGLAEQMDIDATRPRAVGARAGGMGRAAGDLAERRLANDLRAILRQVIEALRQQRAIVRDGSVGAFEVVGAKRVGPRLRRETPGAIGVKGVPVLEPGLPCERVLLALDLGHLAEPDLVDLRRR